MATRQVAFTLLACALALPAATANAQLQLAQDDDHDACIAKADQCDSDCMSSAANYAGAAIGTLLSHNKGNLPALQDMGNSASQSCSQCTALRNSCG
jgi:hypothetical protein